MKMKLVTFTIFHLYFALIQGEQHDSNKTNSFTFTTATTKTKFTSATTKEKFTRSKARTKLSYADYFENALSRGSWGEEDQPCLSKLYKTIEDARNNTLYAVWMLDSMQMVPNGQLYGSGLHLTNYDECLNRHWMTSNPNLNTQYCLAEVKLSDSKQQKGYVPDPKASADVYLKTRTPEDLDLTIMNWGLCLPETCPNTTAAKIFRVLLESSHLGLMAEEATINISSCQVAGEDHRNYESETKFRYLIGTLLTIAVWSTYYTMNHNLNPKSYVHEIISSFCLKRNLNSLTSVNDNNEIYIVNVMRIFSCLLTVTGHLIQLFLARITVSGLLMDKIFGESGALQRHGNLVVDTFFTLSGMLVVRSYLTGSWSNPIKFLIRRYLRLFGVLAVLLYVKSYVLYNLGDGPLWEQTIGNDQKICQTHFWTTFATLSNYVDMYKLCYLISWSTAADFHMSILAAIICYIYGKNKRRGIFTFIVIFLAALVIPGYVSYIHKLPVVYNYGLEAAGNYRENIVFQKTYRFTHTRAGPFLVGMIMGYIIATYKPTKYRKLISRKASYIYLIACLATMNIIIELGGTYFYRNPEAYGVNVFAALNRTVHAAVICVIIGIAEYGDLGTLHEFFKLSPFIPLGRLTYGVYLIHYIIIERHASVIRTGYTTDMFGFNIIAMGVAVISFMLSFFLSLLVEGPIVNVVNVLLDGPRGLRSKGKANVETPVGNDHQTYSNSHITKCNSHTTNSNNHKVTANGRENKHRKDE